MLTVEKIGGTSMSQFQDVLQNIIKGDRKNDELYNRIFVVSACPSRGHASGDLFPLQQKHPNLPLLKFVIVHSYISGTCEH